MTEQIIAPVVIVTVPNADLSEEWFPALAEHTQVRTDYADHRGRLVSGEYVRSGLHADGRRVVVTVSHPSYREPTVRVKDVAVLSVDLYTDFHCLADSPLALHYLGQTWCRERAENGTCIHGDCEFSA